MAADRHLQGPPAPLPRWLGASDRRWLAAAVLLTALTAVMGAIRFGIVGTHSWNFLAKNLFLAWLPALFALAIAARPRAAWYVALPVAALFLVFLPNAPYIVTDLIHLATPRRTVVWLDALVVGSAALSGLVIAFGTVDSVASSAHTRFGGRHTGLALRVTLPLLAALGVYFGRFARWNSWDVVTRPGHLLEDLADRALSTDPWVFTAIFGTCLLTGQAIFALVGRGHATAEAAPSGAPGLGS
jgi:uncharacterized membrane protein